MGKIFLNGNEAIARGAMAAGVKFCAIYPMTPVTGLLHLMAAASDVIFRQPEDEIAAVNMAIGASYAGARAMTATSGGGFCLMTEGLGLAAMTETPLVVINGMRPGPSTGLPTWSGQGDLSFVLSAGQDDFPRVVLAAGDIQEAYDLTAKAFNLADKYQTPVILLVDKNLCENEQAVEDFQPVENILRQKTNKILTNSYEHDDEGYTTEDAEMRRKQMERRMAKLTTCAKEDMPEPQLFGPPDAETTIVSWGSNKGAILEAISATNANYLHLTWLSPFPAEAVKKILTSKKILSVEGNYSGQMTRLIREKTGIEITDNLFKYDGRPIFTDEIIKKLNG